jgi:sulfur carrier protein ThiS
MRAAVVYSSNPLVQTSNRKVVELRHRRRLDKLAPRTPQPFICIRNGEAVLRKHWRRTCVEDGDVVAFVTLVQGGGGGGGGGGKNPLAIIAMLALVVFAPTVAGFLAPGITSAFGIAAINAGVMLAGGALINPAFSGHPKESA